MNVALTERIPRVAGMSVCQDQAINAAVRRFRKVRPYDEPCLRSRPNHVPDNVSIPRVKPAQPRIPPKKGPCKSVSGDFATCGARYQAGISGPRLLTPKPSRRLEPASRTLRVVPAFSSLFLRPWAPKKRRLIQDEQRRRLRRLVLLTPASSHQRDIRGSQAPHPNAIDQRAFN
ncbi:hypothetical protein MRX96_038620 [Rhipicephalus microplus]